MNPAAKLTLDKIYNKISYRLNERLCSMEPNFDDSITGFNEAWEIVTEVFEEVKNNDGGDKGPKGE